MNRKITFAGDEWDPEDHADGYTEWEEVKSKPVLDYDGFYTDYTMWYNEFEDKYVFTFGDKDIYYPENADWDWECENRSEADEWFDDYVGPGEEDTEFEDDDIYSAENIQSSEELEYTATDIVRDMHNKYPKFNFIEEESFPEIDGPGKIRLYFDGSQWPADMEECTDYLKSKGLEVYWNHYKICVVADEDEDVEGCDNMKKAKITASSEDLRTQINNKVDEAVIMLEENIMHDIDAAIPEYDPDWCAEDLQFNYEEAREAFINSMVDDILLAYYPD